MVQYYHYFEIVPSCRGKNPVKKLAAHESGPKLLQPDGSMDFAGVRGLRVCRGGTVLLSGGADGVVKRFVIKDGSIEVRRPLWHLQICPEVLAVCFILVFRCF